jgi:hypothetical protein
VRTLFSDELNVGLVVGEHLVELALGREPTFDLSEFDVERFARGAARAELNVI